MTERHDDTALMADLFNLYEQKMYHTAFRILRDPYLAEDAVQEAFIRLFRHLDLFADPESVQTKAYIIRTVQNTAISLYHKKRREQRRTEAYLQEHAADVQEEDPSGSLWTEEMIAALPARYREVIRLRCLEGKTSRETGELLSITEVAVRKRYERGLALLRKSLKGELCYVGR